jgi:hypothetical protein
MNEKTKYESDVEGSPIFHSKPLGQAIGNPDVTPVFGRV